MPGGLTGFQYEYPGRRLVDPSVYDRFFVTEDYQTVRELRLKTTPPVISKPGNWKESDVVDVASPVKSESGNASTTSRSLSPLMSPLDEKMIAMFPSGRPMAEPIDVVLCKHCKHPLLRIVAANHIRECLRKKQEKLQRKKEAKEAKDATLRKEKYDENDSSASVVGVSNIQASTAMPGGIDAKTTSQPSVGGSGDSSYNPTSPNSRGNSTGCGLGERSKGCGSVGNGNTSRKTALSKKSTDLGAAKKGKKRKADGTDGDSAVNPKKKRKEDSKVKPPRPKLPVNVEKQCGVLMPNGAMCARSLTCKSHSMGAKRSVPGRSLPYDMLLAQYQKNNHVKQQKAAMDANAPLVDDDFDNQGPIDSDEESKIIMKAIDSSRPRPIYKSTLIDTRRRYQYIRMKDVLMNALGGARGAGLFNSAPIHSEEVIKIEDVSSQPSVQLSLTSTSSSDPPTAPTVAAAATFSSLATPSLPDHEPRNSTLALS